MTSALACVQLSETGFRSTPRPDTIRPSLSMWLQPTFMYSPFETPSRAWGITAVWLRVRCRSAAGGLPYRSAVRRHGSLASGLRNDIAAVDTGRTEFNTFRRPGATGAYGRVRQYEKHRAGTDGRLGLLHRLNNRRVNSIDIVAHELAINGDRDGALARWWSKSVSLRNHLSPGTNARSRPFRQIDNVRVTSLSRRNSAPAEARATYNHHQISFARINWFVDESNEGGVWMNGMRQELNLPKEGGPEFVRLGGTFGEFEG